MQEAAPFLGSAVQSHQHRPELTAPRCSSDYSFSPQLALYAGNRHVSELKGLLSSCLWTRVIPGQRGAATAWGHRGDTGQGRWRSWRHPGHDALQRISKFPQGLVGRGGDGEPSKGPTNPTQSPGPGRAPSQHRFPGTLPGSSATALSCAKLLPQLLRPFSSC